MSTRDQIIPARFLRKPRSAGYGNFLFHDEPDVRAAVQGVAILLAGNNFGCGSSREGAVYALVDAGIRCVIAPGFGDIFAGNAGKNGLLTLALAERRDRTVAGGRGRADRGPARPDCLRHRSQRAVRHRPFPQALPDRGVGTTSA